MAEKSDIEDILDKLDRLLKEGTDGNDEPADEHAEEQAQAAEEEQPAESEEASETEDRHAQEDADREDAEAETASKADEIFHTEESVAGESQEEVQEPEETGQSAGDRPEEVKHVVLTEAMLVDNAQSALPFGSGQHSEPEHAAGKGDAKAISGAGDRRSEAEPSGDWVATVSEAVLQRLNKVLPQLIHEAMAKYGPYDGNPSSEARDQNSQIDSDTER
ncbi:MAG: hypothetical protein ACE5F3_01315 [Mariprofundaceae bacterium]